MKNIKILVILSLLLITFSGCERDLPYPLDDVKRGVAIDITRAGGTDGVLGAGVTTGNYKVILQIPKQQGDYSYMKYAQLMCIYTNASKQVKTVIVEDNLKSFPAEITLDMSRICQLLGITAPALGDNLSFTTNVILNSGFTVPGWTAEMGYNNKLFTGWEIDGRAYSYRVSYTAFCPFIPENFIGHAECDENGSIYPVTITALPEGDLPTNMPVGVTAVDLYGLLITDIWDATGTLKVWINKIDYSLIIPAQLVIPGWYNGLDFWLGYYTAATSAQASPCDNSLSFKISADVPAAGGGFGDFTYTITVTGN